MVLGDGDSCPPAVSSDQSLQAQLHNDSSQSSQISQQSSQDSVTSAPSQSNTPNADDSMLPREVRITKHVSHMRSPYSFVKSIATALLLCGSIALLYAKFVCGLIERLVLFF